VTASPIKELVEKEAKTHKVRKEVMDIQGVKRFIILWYDIVRSLGLFLGKKLCFLCLHLPIFFMELKVYPATVFCLGVPEVVCIYAQVGGPDVEYDYYCSLRCRSLSSTCRHLGLLMRRKLQRVQNAHGQGWLMARQAGKKIISFIFSASMLLTPPPVPMGIL